MNKQQVTYLKKRIEMIRDQKLSNEGAACHTALSAIKELSHDKKLDLIYAGKVKLRPRKENEGRYSNYLVDSFDFSEYEKHLEDRKAIQKKSGERCDKLNREATRIIDVAVFKNAEDAVKMLAEFEKF